MSGKKQNNGFTLIEMMVVVTITAILVGLALPSMLDLIERNAVSSNVNNFIGTASYARAEAIKRGVSVVVCRSEDAETAATPTCAAGANDAGGGWATGWLVFADANADGAFDIANGDVVLRTQGSIAGNGAIQQSTFSRLAFRPTGLASSGLSSFDFKSKSEVSSRQKSVCFSIQGRTRIAAAGYTCGGASLE